MGPRRIKEFGPRKTDSPNAPARRGSSPSATDIPPPTDTPANVPTRRQSAAEDHQERKSQDKLNKEAAGEERPRKEDPGKEIPSKEGASKEKKGKDDASKRAAGKEKKSKDDARKVGADKEKKSKDHASKGGADKEKKSKDDASKGGKDKKNKEHLGKKPEHKHRPPVPGTVAIPTTSNFKDPGAARLPENSEQKLPCWKRFCLHLYNREKGTYCGRTCLSWLYIIVYSIMYLLFLSTYMLIFLFATLSIIKSNLDYKNLDKTQMLTYSEYGIGLTATPTTESSYPLIWYRNDNEEDYRKYINSIDKLLLSRKRRDAETSLGQCGRSPYGYGRAPCVIVRINKQLKWTGKPLGPNSTLANAPKEVKDWVKTGRRMLWLHCGGYYSYDKEHIGSISYYPNPPGFDPALFPLDVRNDPPLVAVQFSSFSHGVSLAVECKLWHEHGPSSVEFVIYVEPRDKTHVNVSNTPK